MFSRACVLMDTLVSILVVDPPPGIDHTAHFDRAFGWFQAVEACCSRFDPDSELMRLCTQVGTAVELSPILFEAVQFAVAVAHASDGAFDPTVGRMQAERGFRRNYRTGQSIQSSEAQMARYSDLEIDFKRRTVTLLRPLLLDLGAVAKGLAVDLAARALSPLQNFAIDAGGDLYLGGRNAAGEPWQIGIANPAQPERLLETLRLSDAAVCSSGGYLRPSLLGNREHHILDPKRGQSPRGVTAVTVVAPAAMAADALTTAAFVLGPRAGLRFLERQGVEALLLSAQNQRLETAGFSRYRA